MKDELTNLMISMQETPSIRVVNFQLIVRNNKIGFVLTLKNRLSRIS